MIGQATVAFKVSPQRTAIASIILLSNLDRSCLFAEPAHATDCETAKIDDAVLENESLRSSVLREPRQRFLLRAGPEFRGLCAQNVVSRVLLSRRQAARTQPASPADAVSRGRR